MPERLVNEIETDRMHALPRSAAVAGVVTVIKRLIVKMPRQRSASSAAPVSSGPVSQAIEVACY